MNLSVLKRWSRLIGINLAFFAFFWILIELGLHLVFISIAHPGVSKFASYNQLLVHNKTPLYTPHRYLGYIPTPNAVKNKNKHNSLGFRGEEIVVPKPKNSFRIACIGGSTTYTVKVNDFRDSYPSQLESELIKRGFDHIEVINAGVGGWSTWESLINLQIRLLSLEPDLLVIYHGINDVHARVVWPPEAYRSDNSGRRIDKAKMSVSWWTFLKNRSNIIRIIEVSRGKKASAKSFRYFDDYPETFFMYELDQQFRNNTYPSGVFNDVSLAQMLEANPPSFFKKNLESMVVLAKVNDIEMMLATFTYLESDTKYITATPGYQNAIAAQNILLKKMGAQEQIPVFDFATTFPQDSSLYADAIHVNKLGSQIKARQFADFIINHFLDQPADK